MSGQERITKQNDAVPLDKEEIAEVIRARPTLAPADLGPVLNSLDEIIN